MVVQEASNPNGWRKDGHNLEEKSRWLAFVADPDSGDEIGQITLDSDPVTAPVDRIFCLLCAVREKYRKWHLTGLGLVPTETSKEEYRRVGLIFLRQRDWFGELTKFPPDQMVKLGLHADNRFLTTVTII
jgi:hypothetical protein